MEFSAELQAPTGVLLLDAEIDITGPLVITKAMNIVSVISIPPLGGGKPSIDHLIMPNNKTIRVTITVVDLAESEE